MISFLRQAHRIYSLVIILVFSTLFSPFFYLASRRPGGYGILNWLRKADSFIISALTGVFYVFDFEQALEKDRTYIYCANHSSNYDIMAMCILGRGRFHFMGKEELLDNPVLKIFFRTIDIPVNRESRMSSFRAFKRAADNLDNGMSLIIFPEGKIDDTYPPKLGEFKNGPFRLAIEKNVAIVPVSLTNIWKVIWDDGVRYGTRPGICNIYVHKPVSTSDLNINDADSLKDRIFDLINSKLVYK